MSNAKEVLQQVLQSFETMLNWSDSEMGDGDSARKKAERMIPVLEAVLAENTDSNACITAFEDYFQGDWNDPYFKVERKQWEAAWNTAIEWQNQQNKEAK